MVPGGGARSATAKPVGLRRILGVGFGLAVIVGSTLGIGILRAPGLVAGQVSTPSVILGLWLVGGLYTLLGATCLAELGTMLPRTGGYYVYARRTFGDSVGFAVGWTDWLTYCAVLGYVSIGMGEFTAVLLPPLAGLVKIVAVGALVGFVALLSVLPLRDFARSTLPAADAAQILLGSRGREIITVLSLVSLPPLLNAIMMIGTRILFAMGRDGLLWRRTAQVTAGGAPVAATPGTTAGAAATSLA